MNETNRSWSSLQLITFRFACIYFGWYLLPFPLGLLPFTSTLAGWYGDIHNTVARWIGPNLLGLDVVVQPTGSGDTALAYTLMFLMGVGAAIGTGVWTLLDRRTSYCRTHDLLRVYVRYGLAFTMLSYGAFKIIPTQFPYPPLVRLLEPLGNSSPMGLLWKFMGYSPAFSIFAGLGEFSGGLLLFFRRTTTLGCLLLVVVMSNVVMMNFAYDVPVKLYSSHLLAMTFFLLLPDARRLTDILVLQRATTPPDLGSVFGPGRLRVAGWAAKTLFIGWAVWSTTSTSYQFFERMDDRPALYGIYDVDRFVRNADTVPPLTTDSTRWRRVIIDGGFGSPVATIQTMTGPLQGERAARFRFGEDTAAATLTFTALTDTTDVRSFAFRRLDADRLAVEGAWNGDTLRLDLRRFDERSFPLTSRAYRWVQELPFNR